MRVVSTVSSGEILWLGRANLELRGARQGTVLISNGRFGGMTTYPALQIGNTLAPRPKWTQQNFCLRFAMCQACANMERLSHSLLLGSTLLGGSFDGN